MKHLRNANAPVSMGLTVRLPFIVLGMLAVQAQAQSPGAEVIMGQSRHTPAEKHVPRSDHANFFPNALAPLPAQTYPRKPKKARKHRMDMDRDGYVSRSEFELEHQARAGAFRSADQNQDGKLDAEELRHYLKLVQPRGRAR